MKRILAGLMIVAVIVLGCEKKEKSETKKLVKAKKPDVKKLLGSDAIKKTEELIKKLKHKDARVRCEAARALGEIKDARAVKPLIEALKDTSSYKYRRG